MQEQKEEDRICGKIEADGDEPDINCLDKFLIREPSNCVEKSGDTQKHLQGNLTRGQEEIQNPMQRRVLTEG